MQVSRHFTQIWRVALISAHINMQGEQLDTIDSSINKMRR